MQSIQLRLARATHMPIAQIDGKEAPAPALRFYAANLFGWLTMFSVIQVGCALPYTLLSLDSSVAAVDTTNASSININGSGMLELERGMTSAVPGSVPLGESLYFSWIVTTTVG